MPLNPDAVGTKTKPGKRSWDSKDSLIYALGVGCGTDDMLLTANRTFEATAREAGVAVHAEYVPGGHAWDYWDAAIQRVLAWLPLG